MQDAHNSTASHPPTHCTIPTSELMLIQDRDSLIQSRKGNSFLKENIMELCAVVKVKTPWQYEIERI